MPTNTEIAIDGQSADPVMARALESIARNARIGLDRTARIKSDTRVIRLRAMKSARQITDGGMTGALRVFHDMASGRAARDARIAALVRARVGQIDRNPVASRDNLREAASIRRKHWTRCEAITAPAAASAVNLRDGVMA